MGHMTMATPIFDNFRGHVRTDTGNMFVKFGVRIFSRIEQLAFNAQKFTGGYLTLATPPFRKFLSVMCGLSRGTCLPV